MTEAEREADFERAWMEKEARARAAWGRYVTQMNSINLERECDELRDKLSARGKYSDEKIEKKVKKVKNSKPNLFYIG